MIRPDTSPLANHQLIPVPARNLSAGPVIDVHLDEDAKTLVIEWNNRDLGRSNVLVMILSVFWIFSIGLFGVSVWVTATG